jgi:proline iminopeptidase
MTTPHPPIEPHAQGRLAVGDGHELHWEVCGRPDGMPAVVLHGGPGSGASASARRLFDPAVWRVVLFDQRGCGRSTPHASEKGTDLATNTTAHLLTDIERLREHLAIARWLVLGGSWGSTLALAYAQRHLERVTGLVLRGVATTTAAEIAWITRGVGLLLPDAFERFRGGVPPAERDGDLVEAYHRLLIDPDPAVHEPAARAWCDWEAALVAVHPDHVPDPRFADARFRLAFARLVTHYWRHRAWLADGELLAGAPRLAGVPAIMVHGRLDLAAPLATPWALAKAWPGSELVIVDRAGHDTRDPGMTEAIVAAIARLARRLA